MTEIIWPEGLIRIPETETVIERLSLAGLLGVTPETDYFIELFARQIHGLREDCSSLAAALLCAKRQMGGELAETITNDFGGVIVNAVCQDSQIAANTMRIVRGIQDFSLGIN